MLVSFTGEKCTLNVYGTREEDRVEECCFSLLFLFFLHLFQPPLSICLPIPSYLLLSFALATLFTSLLTLPSLKRLLLRFTTPVNYLVVNDSHSFLASCQFSIKMVDVGNLVCMHSPHLLYHFILLLSSILSSPYTPSHSPLTLPTLTSPSHTTFLTLTPISPLTSHPHTPHTPHTDTENCFV